MKGSLLIKLGIVLVLISSVMIVTRNADKILNEFNNDYLLSRIVVNNIEENYEVFNTNVNTYKEDMTTFYGSLDFYFDNFVRKNRVMVANLKVVESDIRKLENSSLKLYENCKYDIDDEETREMCKNYKINLEGVINSYNKLVVDYNEVLESFNGFARGHNKNNLVVDRYESVMSEKLLKINEELNKEEE